ncbi:family 16 glycoside hydrolase [Halalkalibaculum sp. DA3122]|uniref:family 16 glycoside hydrolase n=1 Tax=Halalkalibaculum sp. DA3122 TaxID=3373607 RepID=UPI0037551D01
MGFCALFFVIQACGTSKEERESPVETLSMNQISLENLEAFQTVTDNWTVAGGVESDRQTEHDLNPLEGTGILVNIPNEEHQEHIFTQWEHGDLELELDFLMPKGSNSGIYLMGRYEVQLLDSWGVDEPQFSDVGGIYQRWDDSQPEGQKGFEGSAPLLNAARAPGLWQHYRILFQAPEFDENGNKISNAKFKEVWLNGSLVQEDVEVTGPTRAAAFQDEVPEGPLMIQGDHGPVALRNIEYKRYDKTSISLDDLTYEYYPGEYDQMPDFSSLEAGETANTDSLAGNVVERDDRYALRYTGTLEAPNSGTYLFKLRNAGMVRMLIDGQPVFDQSEVHRVHQLASKTMELESGQHSFTLEYLKHPNNWYWGLSLFAEGPKLRLQPLHKSSSVPGSGRELQDLVVNPPDDRVKTLRSFAMHNGGKRTHVVNIGSPNGINYSYDLGQFALLNAWEGPFVNTNEMWINRGQPQIAKPAGPPVIFRGHPAIAELNSPSTAWPDSLSWDQLDVQGYSIGEGGWPTFKYSLGEVQVRDRFTGTDDNRRLIRTVELEAPQPQQDIWFQLASGDEISQNSSGEYVVDDRTYYLNVVNTGSQSPQVVQNGEDYDLRIPVLTDGTETIIEYEIIW